MELSPVELLRDGLSAIGILSSDTAQRRIMRHLELVLEWNERINLTAICEVREMVIKHAVDSASVLRQAYVQEHTRVLDVGSGAGFPGVTIKCLVPACRITLAESLGKRCRFLEAVRQELFPDGNGLGEFSVVWARAEDLGHQMEYREQFDLVVARAVADLRVLSEYCLPFVKRGGHFIAMKGPDVTAELEGAAEAVRTLGGGEVVTDRFTLPGGNGLRTLVRMTKVKPTPGRFPRKAGIPAKSPL